MCEGVVALEVADPLEDADPLPLPLLEAEDDPVGLGATLEVGAGVARGGVR